ncbi:MAG: magnesium protoporphyrin IX methyltransferase [Rhodoferax sp.]|uniref:magnesium protoporphyrin IX methyltransferase n=1 Tax=Polynucleobacter sp. MG-Unter2-18 TaxID=2081052 RepID=UPI001BFD8362|nr:magnesium protoporphyrin IX methyltransferase [Polynucleobacter sp. MG-Unter2-18]MCF8165478.1 magnesium protoporphyrin IX methyltransferase [Rhodoferax sp.]MCF8191014.1 magnesium protoporphyrin IX methyltransferase [Polynucleobacter sp.]QWD93888.1 magnesium protoporphyrin IX methyltransferase [Polynucleobacter sp. MG-Unter2-18]
MSAISYLNRRSKLQDYFDRTANDAWAKLTSDAPVSGIRATVRAGRDQMRSNLIARLPESLSGKRILDAGCGTGALALELANKGASVVAIDLSPNLIELAKERIAPADRQNIDFRSGDMLDDSLGEFDYVVGMDSMIHYCADDMLVVLEKLAPRVSHKIVFTFAPSTLPLEIMIRVGRLFPRKDRAPFIEPISQTKLSKLIDQSPWFVDWKIPHTQLVSSGFYKSQLMEIEKVS